MSNPYQPNLDPNYVYTPQPPAPVLAGWPLRFASGLVDLVITAVLAGIASLAGQALGYVVELIVLVVFGFLEGTRGQTPGKMVVGLRTVKLADGTVLGAGLGIGRRILHLLDAIACFIGYLWPLWDEKRQTFADKLVSSVVIKVQ
ncbi:RDD family protein [Kitasatospora sp. RB6PN24]|uniref:RDD family protein n=1 Tax=Kitasatospora humi TaxID=2893891 RepID=UPI001E43B5E4|nr:RDD family protein [Kitasatospora humi]MCC9310524.1 RDD family protein [Kitasatospora humi]